MARAAHLYIEVGDIVVRYDWSQLACILQLVDLADEAVSILERDVPPVIPCQQDLPLEIQHEDR